MIKIVILGGGFGGISAALELSKRIGYRHHVRIILIDRNNYQTFQPSLYEVASAFGIAHKDHYHTRLQATISVPFDDIFKNRNIETIQAELKTLDLENKFLETNGGHKINFDYLILATGSESATFGINGINEYTYKFKTREDALMLFEDVEKRYQASSGQDGLPVKFIVAGAGFTGIELAAELSLCGTHIAHKHRITSTNCTEITLVEAGPVILPIISEREREIVKKRLTKLGVKVMENTAIGEVADKNTVHLRDGQTMTADFIIWTAGVKAPDFLKSISELELDEKSGRILVNEFLQIKNQKNIFAVGDSIIMIDPATKKPVPQMAPIAIKQGQVAAHNIIQIDCCRTDLKSYTPAYGSWVAPLGGKHALAHIGRWLEFHGFLGWAVRELIDARYFFSILSVEKAFALIIKRMSVFLKND